MKPSTTTALFVLALAFACYSSCSAGRLFPAGLPAAKWRQFAAEGFSVPVSGMIYRGDPIPPSGAPVGSIDTGCLDIEATGMLGYNTIFNDLTPRGGPMNKPFLGISVGGKTWVLTTGKTKAWDGGGIPHQPHPNGGDLALTGVEKAESIDYWGHYPMVDMEFNTTAPVSVGLRAWSPFLPGDSKTSNTPACIFEVHLRNTSNTRQSGTLAFSFPGFDFGSRTMTDPAQVKPWPGLAALPKLPQSEITCTSIRGATNGVSVQAPSWKMSYALAAVGEKTVRKGGELGGESSKWSSMERALPAFDSKTGGASLAVDFKLKPGQERTVRFVLSWYAPEWDGKGVPGVGGNKFTHMYASRFTDAVDVARFVAKNRDSLLNRIIAWQSAIYSDPNTPGWLADSLINSLYLFAEDSVWAQAKAPIGDWCKLEEGFFAMNESPRSCPQMQSAMNTAIGLLAVDYFFPELERTSLRAFRAYQREDGEYPCMYGRYWELTTPMYYGYQTVQSGATYIVLLDRYYKLTGDDQFLKDFYPSAKKALKYSFSLRPQYGDAQIVAMPDPAKGDALEWYEDRFWVGYVAHPGGYRLAAAEMMRDWALKMGDTEYAAELDRLIAAGKAAMEEYLWNGRFYDGYNEPESGKRMDAFFTVQLNGQMYAYALGVPPIFPKDHAASVLEMLKKACWASKLGIPPTLTNSDGSTWHEEVDKNKYVLAGYLTGKTAYIPSTGVYFSAMTFMYEDQKNQGLAILRRFMDIYAGKWGYTWEAPNVQSGIADTGESTFGSDYFMNLAIWGVPAALQGQDVSGPCKPGGLIDRILKAANS